MAHRKINEVEENYQATENYVSKKLAKVVGIKPRHQLKRKINECEHSENASEPNQRNRVNQKSLRKSDKSKDLDDKEISSVCNKENTSIGNKKIKTNKPRQNKESLKNGKVVQNKMPTRSQSKKTAESKNTGEKNGNVGNKKTVTEQKTPPATKKKASQSETVPKIKKAKVVLHKLDLDQICKDKTERGNKKTVTEQKTPPATKKKASQSETVPKIKKAKVVLHKLDLDQICKDKTERVSADSINSSMIPDSPLKIENDTSIMATLKSTSQSLKNSAEASSSEEEWEEVEDSNEPDLDDYKPIIPKEGVEITIDCPDLKLRKRKKNKFDWRDCVRLNINRQRKECQLNIHKTHLLCLLAHGFYVNNLLNSPMLKGVALSVLPSDLMSRYCGRKIDKIDSRGIENIVKWFRNAYSFGKEKDYFLDFSESIVSYFKNNHCSNASEYNLMFVVLARTLGFKTRFCISLYALTHKAQNLIKKSRPKKEEKQSQDLADGKTVDENVAGPSEVRQEKPQTLIKELKDKKPKKVKESQKPTKAQAKKGKDSGLNGVKAEKRPRPKRSTKKSYKISDSESEGDNNEEYVLSEDDFQEQKPPRKSLSKASKPKKGNQKVLSSESSPSSPEVFKGDKITCWAEVFSKQDKQWIPIECVNNIINEPYRIEESLPQPVSYIIAFDSESHVKDVTRRYCSDYMTSTIKLRPDSDWWEEALLPFSPPDTKFNKEEEKNLENLLINKPLPHTVAGFKNHPLYALKRHLLKFEAIYPPDAKPVGFMRGEPVYPRECVCHLHSRENWLKEARVVRIGEEPYKIVKGPRWDRINRVIKKDVPSEIFGFWQTEPYEPPKAVDGKVPRNEYGNVELFKPCMLPRGTVHLRLPGLNRIAKKLGIDCSPAVVGFDGHKGSIHAVFDGFIICEEFKDTIIAAWDEEQVNAQKREEEKREKRIYGNWKKLIRGLLIRERIKLKYDTK